MATDERIAKMLFSKVYPLYLAKVERKGRTQHELNEIIRWLTGFSQEQLQHHINQDSTFETLFEHATLNSSAQFIKGVICGHRVEEIKNPLTQKVRYLDKLVDELAKGRAMDKILRSPDQD